MVLFCLVTFLRQPLVVNFNSSFAPVSFSKVYYTSRHIKESLQAKAMLLLNLKWNVLSSINQFNARLFCFCATASAFPCQTLLAPITCAHIKSAHFRGTTSGSLHTGISKQEREVRYLTPLITAAIKGSCNCDISSFWNHLASQKANGEYKIKARSQSRSSAPVSSSGTGQRVHVILWKVLQQVLLGMVPSNCPACHMSCPSIPPSVAVMGAATPPPPLYFMVSQGSIQM